jgi:hypothetical protein
MQLGCDKNVHLSGLCRLFNIPQEVVKVRWGDRVAQPLQRDVICIVAYWNLQFAFASALLQIDPPQVICIQKFFTKSFPLILKPLFSFLKFRPG